MNRGADSIRVIFSCSSVGITHRGIESFFSESFANLIPGDGIEGLLLKGGGDAGENEVVIRCIPKTSRMASALAKITGRSSYAVEQWTSFPGIAGRIRKFRPHVVFTSDANLVFLLNRFRRQIGVPFKILFSNGGPCHPPFDRFDFVHQVAPHYLEEAINAGEAPSKHFLVPYGIQMSDMPVVSSVEKNRLRAKLRLPADRHIILSVGWISRVHKRMDYLIEEVARLPSPRPFLQLLGAMDDQSQGLVDLANKLLGPDNFGVASVPYDEVKHYYRAADLFVLASLKEGFGRVYLESMMHGLPTIAHRHPVMEYVVGNEGVLSDLSQSGNLAYALAGQLSDLGDSDGSKAMRRWESVRSRFSWAVLRPQYEQMFRHVAAGSSTLALS